MSAPKDNRPARKRGGDRKSEEIKHNNVMVDSPAKQGNTRLYIEERLKRDHPKIWKDYNLLHRSPFQLVYVHLAGLN